MNRSPVKKVTASSTWLLKLYPVIRSVTEAAQQLDVNRVTLSRVLNGRAAISPEMALRIEAWLGVERGGEARLWLAEQSACDMWQAEQRFKIEPMRVQPAPSLRAETAA